MKFLVPGNHFQNWTVHACCTLPFLFSEFHLLPKSTQDNHIWRFFCWLNGITTKEHINNTFCLPWDTANVSLPQKGHKVYSETCQHNLAAYTLSDLAKVQGIVGSWTTYLKGRLQQMLTQNWWLDCNCPCYIC